MLQSPAKRRKISENAALTVHDSDDRESQPIQPTTPTRASYLSPTKASLARSHPHLISQAQRRSLTEPRGKLLRNELLAGRRAEQQQQPFEKDLSQAQPDEENGNRGPSNSAEEPRNPFLPGPNEPIRPRSPLRPRQPPPRARSQPRSSRNNSGFDIILPKLVTRNEAVGLPADRSTSKEPELPPTPVQLGLDAAPERPRGLGSSSSPRGSRSGSGRHRVRVRGGGSITSSPLKPKDRLPIMQAEDDRESEVEQGQEAAESEADDDEAEHDSMTPTEIKEKRSLLLKLQNELTKLKGQTSKLENIINDNKSLKSPSVAQDVINLLHSHSETNTNRQPNTEYVSRHGMGNASSYLTLFSPGRLNLTTKTDTMIVDGHPKVVHTFNVLAPSPWPIHMFFAVFEVVTDAEGLKVESIVGKDMPKPRRQSASNQPELQSWIDKRLESDLHKQDIGGLIWGMGQYFNECIERARILKRLDEKYNKIETEGVNQDEEGSDDRINEEKALALLKYITTSKLEFDMEEDSTIRQTRHGKHASPKLMLSWNIELTWTGDVNSTMQVTPTGIPNSTQPDMQDVFQRLVNMQGVEAAVEGIWDLIRGKRDEIGVVTDKVASSDGPPKGTRGRPRKRKRFS